MPSTGDGCAATSNMGSYKVLQDMQAKPVTDKAGKHVKTLHHNAFDTNNQELLLDTQYFFFIRT